LNVRGFCRDCMNALDAEWDTSEEAGEAAA
jgi:hypothetical protein